MDSISKVLKKAWYCRAFEQKVFSLITECSELQPSLFKGNTVGLFNTGKIFEIASILSFGAFNKMYLDSLAFKTACDLVFKGKDQSSGYTEPLLHLNRSIKKNLRTSR